MAAAHWRMRMKNEILPDLQDKFEAALNEGTILELEPGDISMVNELLGEGPSAAASA